jgi:hypothetical protein
MKKYRALPPHLAELRESDPARFKEACRRGGRNADKSRVRKKKPLTSAQIWAEIDASLAPERLQRAMCEAAAIASERGDHLLADP